VDDQFQVQLQKDKDDNRRQLDWSGKTTGLKSKWSVADVPLGETKHKLTRVRTNVGKIIMTRLNSTSSTQANKSKRREHIVSKEITQYARMLHMATFILIFTRLLVIIPLLTPNHYLLQYHNKYLWVHQTGHLWSADHAAAQHYNTDSVAVCQCTHECNFHSSDDHMASCVCAAIGPCTPGMLGDLLEASAVNRQVQSARTLHVNMLAHFAAESVENMKKLNRKTVEWRRVHETVT